jgi:hypothetical protein
VATLGELKTRVITEVNRDDLADDLATILQTYIERSIDFYSSSRFWFNEFHTTSTFAINEQYTDIPEGVREIDDVWIIVGSVRYRLMRQEMADLEALYSVPLTGQPTDYAVFGTQIRLWPTPNIAYSGIWIGIRDVTPLVDDDSSNYWTIQGQDLIDARTRYLLYRDEFRDDFGTQQAGIAMDEAYRRLKGETNRRIGVGVTLASW